VLSFIEEYSPRRAIVVCNEKEERLHGEIRIKPRRPGINGFLNIVSKRFLSFVSCLPKPLQHIFTIPRRPTGSRTDIAFITRAKAISRTTGIPLVPAFSQKTDEVHTAAMAA